MVRRNNKDKTIKIETTTMTDQTGDVKQQKSTKTIVLSQEPNYIKLYINTILAFRDLPKTMNAILIELLKLMTFANPEEKHGGQLIFLNKFAKEGITERLNIKINTLEQALTKFTKSGILKRVGTGTYQANPHMFGRGEWLDIKSIRATFDFNTGTVDADITINDESIPQN
jgi:hypothetical protein